MPDPPLPKSPFHGLSSKTSLKNRRSGFLLPYLTRTIGIRASSIITAFWAVQREIGFTVLQASLLNLTFAMLSIFQPEKNPDV